ncbi:5-methyltetrahydropteroyltriglutamate--homocysteine S-methyltransferase [Rhodospira trueperi]|uniref:5-methyltetrahydropteroyltriglutamate--homocysteine methyltransferase n=1 Tax=Rhodospira trueperi TaxID=69960 RepID=A0A1G7EZ64_9PROT|nr:5-methyltetrahydropteroyltriglutamate--homocysteine S-methyltransferase [Rhodospira trueperi]SDE68924.1 5-methyltetrahydropteroyltriglutamate--homocysteine methyltransferase [Rhodospira trueperi]
MTRSAILGFPRIGAHRDLKKAVEAHWKGQLDHAGLNRVAADLRARHWTTQKGVGIDVIPSNDFSFYDQVLDMTAALGAVPARFGHDGGPVGLNTLFAMARGTDDAPAMEMTKWFDTNYHYIVPELHTGQQFTLSTTKAVDEFNEAKALGIETRPVLIGPVTWLSLGKAKEPGFDPLSLLEAVLPVYVELLSRLASAGAEWVQMDEPILALDLTEAQRKTLKRAYGLLSEVGPKLMLATYFEGLRDNTELATGLPVSGLHIDLVRAPDQLDAVLEALRDDAVLSLGVIDGRNVWRADLEAALGPVDTAVARLGPDRVQVAPSCSLLHTPVDLDLETGLDAELRSWMAFSVQKLGEVVTLATAARTDRAVVADTLAASSEAAAARRTSTRIHDAAVAARLAAVTPADTRRHSPFPDRQAAQRARLGLPAFPTTTIGSFPQTTEVRQKRAAFRRGDIDQAAYDGFLKDETERTVRIQEELGLDVLVHGEFERNDMVEYFGEHLSGFAFTRNGWVQSYGSRCVKPPVIFGDVSRPEPMTVGWSSYAQSLTARPMKGMLTGPVTILNWSFVRDDVPRSQTCRQIALAIRDEVVDLEAAGIGVIQIDEPALREGLPLRTTDWDAYLAWAVESFRLASSGVADETQIHTHMCYCEFNDIMPSIAALDADVISIETSRSDMELLDAFVDFHYPNEIGPGVWDIHAPRVPPMEEMRRMLEKAAKVLPADNLWVNPDCGLKTRGWPEVKASLENLVTAARSLRQSKAA